MIYTDNIFLDKQFTQPPSTPTAGSDHPSAGSHSQEPVPPMRASWLFITVTLVLGAISFQRADQKRKVAVESAKRSIHCSMQHLVKMKRESLIFI